MPLDGITVSSLTHELSEKLIGGKIDKIHQPEKDEINLVIRNKGVNHKLLLTANASHPRIHLTNQPKDNPLTAPLFCMVLRKHISGGTIKSIVQPDFERIIELEIEAMNELGDYSTKRLLIEIMGKHSNIIFIDDKDIILDSVKHITFETSSVREILPGKRYIKPPTTVKQNPLLANPTGFIETIKAKPNDKIQAAIYTSYNGISPIMGSDICNRAGIDAGRIVSNIENDEMTRLAKHFIDLFDSIKSKAYVNMIYKDDTGKTIDFSSVPITLYDNLSTELFSSSEMLEIYYQQRDITFRVSQKSQDLRRVILNGIERCVKKRDIQQKTLEDIKNRDLYKTYGDLLTAYAYSIPVGAESFTTVNYYDTECPEITIKLAKNKSGIENAQIFYKRYNKEKRTFAALAEQTKQNDEELFYLDGILAQLQNSADDSDIDEIRQELAEQGIIKKKAFKKGRDKVKKSKPLKYISSDGFEIFVGKNNMQNDELTLRVAAPNDIWLHTKDIPGSHVIIKTEMKEAPDRTIEEAAMLAAFYSKGREGSIVAVDYAQKRNVKKPSGAKPGMVIYERNKTAFVKPIDPFVGN